MWNWLTANTALANTKGMRQPAHKDSGYHHPQFPYYFIANVPLCDFSIENGATEFWLGSHAATSSKDQIVAKSLEDLKPYGKKEGLGEPLPPITEQAKQERAAVRPPIQPQCCKGDIMIRDLRTWHAGMPNLSGGHRIMLGLGYQVSPDPITGWVAIVIIDHFQSPSHPGEKLSLHLPLSQKDFFTNHPANIEIRAKWYTDEDLAATTDDIIFDTRPTFRD